jgi:hypothetical protein
MNTPSSISRFLYDTYEKFRLSTVAADTCMHARVQDAIGQIIEVGGGTVRRREMGESIEGRNITLLSAGTGPRSVLLWSQMHGDEPTATLALLDILNWMSQSPRDSSIEEILSAITVHVIPLVNPDGAERRMRYNAAGIDINRDAHAAVSPEARVLLQAQRELAPEFGFNLHDQDLRSVGSTSRHTALALLAPPSDDLQTVSHTRIRAMRIGAQVVKILLPYIQGHIAKYDDGYEPRAFGDVFQSMGTSTLLIESGHWPGDPQKEFIRKLNVVAILSALWSIATHSYEDAELEYYHEIPVNGRRVFDLVVRGLQVRHPRGWTAQVDLGIMFERNSDRAIIKEIGDLSTFGALETHSLGMRTLPPELARVDTTVRRQEVYDLLNIYKHSQGSRS